MATYRLYEISRNKSSSKEIEVAKQCTENLLDVRPHFYQVVEDIQRNGKDTGFETLAGARFPLNRLRLDPPFLGSSALYRGFGLCK